MTQKGFNDRVVQLFVWSTVFWGVCAVFAGVWIAAQLIWPDALTFSSLLSYGRLRPIHTNLAIFAFGGSILFAVSYYSVQRTSGVRLFGKWLPMLTFWGWQLIIVLAVWSLLQGYSSAKEYAEFEWPIDILITLVWVVYAICFFGTLAKRKIKHIYVSNWFFGAYIIAIAILHIFNSLEIPVSLWKSYSIYAGAQDAMVQWWYGHNAVGFLLTSGFLGIAYYVFPKQANRPVYSYRFSIIHFWSLVFIYMWAGPHHLHYTALPDWLQSLGMVFSIILWMPSWGGMINIVMTLSGAWALLRTDPILKFLVTSITFYGMSTFEGPLMAIKSVNALSHYTDWVIAHVHSGTLGWVSMITFGALYFLTPRVFGKKKMYSTYLMDVHFWVATLGIICYLGAMWSAGFMQGLMWQEFEKDGTLTYTFIETLKETYPYYIIRLFGGIFFLTGMFILLYNIYMTARKPEKEDDDLLSSLAQADVKEQQKGGVL